MLTGMARSGKSTKSRWTIKFATREGGIMLILTRRVGEKIVIGENVTVTVLSVKGNQVRIGIDAPRNVSVNREEIFERIQKEKQTLNGSDLVRTPDPKARGAVRTLSLSGKR